MKKVKDLLQGFAEKTDLPRTVVAGVPQTVISGFREVAIDLQCGLEEYSPEQIVVSVPNGKIFVGGNSLRIRLMKERRIVLVGNVDRLELRRSDL